MVNMALSRFLSHEEKASSHIESLFLQLCLGLNKVVRQNRAAHARGLSEELGVEQRH